MLRENFRERLNEAMRGKDGVATATIRLIMASLKDRDIAARSKGNTEGISDDEILSMLQTMIKQRRESAGLYKRGGREELAAREEEEIAIIESFMPRQMDETEIAEAVEAVIRETGAGELKDMGRVMGRMKELYAGQMDFAQASTVVKEKLAK